MSTNRAKMKSPARTRESLNAAIGTLHQAHAVATVAKRAAMNDMVEAHVLADVLVAVLLLLDNALEALDTAEVAS